MSARKFLSSRSAQGREKSRQLRFEPLEGRRLLAVDFHLLADVNQTQKPVPASIGPIVTIGATAYFSANDGVSGQELWKSDGTSEGTVRVKDIFPGDKGSNPRYLTEFQGVLYFAASDRYNSTTFYDNEDVDVELWRSDGTEAGTYRVKELVPGESESRIGQPMNAGGTLFFAAADSPGSATVLWKSDGTEAGTRMVTIPNVFYQPEFPILIGSARNALLFTDNGDLWSSDGTGDGTFRLKKFSDGPSYTEWPRVLSQTEEMTYFTANDGSGFGLWRTDGTVAGTFFIKEIEPSGWSPGVLSAASLGNTIIFGARDSEHGDELWKSDGTPEGTELLKDLRPGDFTWPWDSTPTLNSSRPAEFTAVDGFVYFLADSDAGLQLWRTDGAAEGTVLVKDLPGNGGNPRYSILENIGGTLYFSSGFSDASGPWIVDGTEAGMTPLKYVSGGTYSSHTRPAAELNGNVLFLASDGIHGTELWRSDSGTAAGAALVKDILPATAGSEPSLVTNVAGAIFFKANDGLRGEELWTSNGDMASTRLVKDIRPGLESSSINYLVDVGGTLFFTANDGATGQELWKSDGTAAGTVLVRDIIPGIASSGLTSLVNIDGTLYFVANDGVAGTELWKSDGTEAGTVRVKDISAGATGSAPEGLREIGGVLYFSANDGIAGREMWRSDGSEAGTHLVADLEAGVGASNPHSLTNVGGMIYFSATTGDPGGELWKSDGTAAGTVRVKNFVAGLGGVWPFGLANVNGELHFVLRDGNDAALWKSDGTEAGTVEVPGFDGSDYYSIAVTGQVGPTLFIVGSSFSAGKTLWSSDGLGDSLTTLIRESPLSNFVVWDNHLYFTKYDRWNGNELWRTDGTHAGTKLVRDFSNDKRDSFVGWPALTVVGDRLVLTVTTDRYGAELWISDPPSTLPAGDYDGNGRVDGGDFLAWQRGFGGSTTPAGSGADGDASGAVDAGDLALWKEQFGAGMASETAPLFAPHDAAPAGLWELGMQVDDAVVQVESNQAASLAVHDFHDYAALAQAVAAADSSTPEPRDRGGKNLLAKKNALAVVAAGERETRQDAALRLLAYDSCADAGDWRAADLSDELPATRSSLRRTGSSAGERRRGSAFESLHAEVK